MGSCQIISSQNNKMSHSVISVTFATCLLLLAVFHVPHVQATVPLVVGTATILTAEQFSAIFAIGLAIKAISLKANLIAASSRGRGRRAAEISAQEIFDIETLVELEEEDCFKRIFCAAATNKVKNVNVNGILDLLERDLSQLQAPLSRGAEKFLSAASYGKLSRNVDKCENRYQCPIKLDMVQTLFPSQN